MGDIWERLPDETSVAYQAFQTYRDMGTERSIAEVGKTLGKSASLMERWSSKHQWVERVRAYESYVDTQELKALLRQRKDLNKKHIQTAGVIHQEFLKELLGLFKDETKRGRLADIPADRLVGVVLKTVELERKMFKLDEESDIPESRPSSINSEDFRNMEIIDEVTESLIRIQGRRTNESGTPGDGSDKKL